MLKFLIKTDYHPKLIEILVKSTFVGALGVNIIAPIVGSIVIYDFIPHVQIYIWLFLHIFIFIVRIFIAKKLQYFLNRDSDKLITYLYIKFLLISLSAFLYAFLMWQLMEYTTGAPIFIIYSFISLLVAGAISTLSSVFIVFVLFSSLTVLPIIFSFFYHNGETFNLFAVISIIFFIILILSGYRQYIMLRDAIMLKETFEMIYEKSSDGIFLIKNGKFVSCNESIVKIFKYISKHEVLNLSLSKLSPKLQPDGKESSKKIDEMINIAMKNGQNSFEWLYIKSDGEEFWAEIVLTKINLAGEDLIHMVIRDISERKVKDELLIQQSRQAAMGEMIGNIAHQWRQPLNALGLVLQNLNFEYQMGTLDDEFMQRSVDKGQKLTQTMSKTIDDFRDFFKPNKLKEYFKISDVINSTIDLIGASYDNNSIKIVLNLDQEIEFHGYPSEFSQVILNILNNAKDVLVEKSIETKEVKISTFQKNSNIIINISDNAGGIPSDVIEKVFEPYFTTKEEGKGTGIGLYMSKTIIETNMKGSLSVINENNGAKFIIVL